MPIIFAAVDGAFNAGSIGSAIVRMGLALLATGAVVGATHGVVLVRFARHG